MPSHMDRISYLNMQHHNIKFAIELEENKLAFRDAQVTRYDANLSTCVYLNPTHPDSYIHFNSDYQQE